jgi:FtsH-binding integral membrane protein
LGESLNATRSKTKGQLVSVDDGDPMKAKLSLVLFGVIAVVYGCTIYFVLPGTFLTLNLGLMLDLFFLILLGMIFGLTLIAFNLQRIIEIFFINTLLFLEKQSMRILILKNLTAHRESNKLTSIIFSLTLGCIIFIVVAANLQFQIFDTS